MRVGNKLEGKEALEKLAQDVVHHNYSFVELVAELQDEVAKLFIEEFGVCGVIDMQSLPKMARIMSKYAASENVRKLRKYPKVVQNHFAVWRSLKKEALQANDQHRRRYSAIPAKLSFYYLFNGELCRGVVCILDYLDLVPNDFLIADVALRWLLFLGETELAEKKMKAWKTEKHSQEFFEAARLTIEYVKTRETRPDTLKTLVAMRDKIKSENVRSFPKYDLASFVAWVCSTLSNVQVSANLEGLEFPDRLSQLQEACSKADSIIRNRAPGLSSYQFDNSVSSSIWTFLEDKKSATPTEYIHLGSALAWHFEMRRELAFVNVATAQTRDSMSAMILNLRTALKSASLFRILQATNCVAYYTTIIEEPGSENNAKIMRASLINLISADPVIVHCSTPVKSAIPSRAQTPLPGEKTSSVGNEKGSETMIQEVADLFSDLDIVNEKMFHRITRNCGCNICVQYPLSSSFASEYMFAFCIFSNFSQFSISHFNTEFVHIRERDMSYQLMMHNDRGVRPRPNAIQNEVFGLCVVQWLIRKVDKREKADEETLEVYKNAMKIVRYLHCRTVDLLLAVTQLGRQLEFPQNCNYSWMQPVVRKPLVKTGIDCAIDILRAVSPFGRRSQTNVADSEGIVSSPRFDAIQNEMRTEMTRYGHILYRDWRCRMFPYVGRTSNNAWEAAYAWAESTSIGSRNAVQMKLERCRRGLVTMSGPDRFKKCVKAMPDDMTLVHIAMADNKQIYLIKLHADREPIIMPLAHHSQAVELMEKFTFLLEEDERIAKFPGDMTPEEFWKKRKIIDGRMMTFVEEVQKNFFDVSASLLMPSDRLGPAALEVAVKIHKLSKQGLRPGEAKDLVFLSEHMDLKSWEKLCLRFCEMRVKDPTFIDLISGFHKYCLEAIGKDRKNGHLKPNKKYTYLVICPQLSQFCWERLPIFNDFPYVARQVSIHSIFSQLEAMRNQEKQIPLQIDVQNAYYVLDPENNLGETKRRMLDYIHKFKWEGTVGTAPNYHEITTALAKYDAFFYFGHGSGSSVMPRSVIKQATCNAISMLMGCGSVRTIPQALGFDGKSALMDYAMAKCPLIVGCLWTVTDGEIDRYLMRMVDDCFERTRGVSGIDKLRQLSEAMAEARSKAKLKYLTGAAVVMYGLPVVSKPADIEKENKDSMGDVNEEVEVTKVVPATPSRREAILKTPTRLTNRVLKIQQQPTSVSQTSKNTETKTPKIIETIPKTPKQSERITKTPKRAGTIPISSEATLSKTSSLSVQSSRNVRNAAPRTPRAVTKNLVNPEVQLFAEEAEEKSSMALRTRSSARTPSRSRQN